MSKRTNKTTIMGTIVLLAVFVFPAALCQAAQVTSSEGYALLIEQTPVDAGFVTPEPGIHEGEADEILKLRAVPKPGYKFLYWLGDVGNMSESETYVSMESPKIVIAVFARPGNYDGGGGGTTPGIGAPAFHQNTTPIRPSTSPGKSTPTPKEKPDDDPVPEPITLLTLGLGSLLVMKSRKK